MTEVKRLYSPVSSASVKDKKDVHLSLFSTSTPRFLHDDPFPSPDSTVASLTRELEDTLQTLDLQAAMRGQFVVKPQV